MFSDNKDIAQEKLLLDQNINSQIEIYRRKIEAAADFYFDATSYIKALNHKIEVLEAALSFLNNTPKGKNTYPVSQAVNVASMDYNTEDRLLTDELHYPLWVKGTTTRNYVQQVKTLKGIDSRIILLETRIAERLSVYLQNMEDIKNTSIAFNKLSKILLWGDKIYVLISAKAFLHDKDLNKFMKDLDDNYRWIKGVETKALVNDIKEFYGIPRNIIDLETKIIERINVYKKNQKNEKKSWFGINKEKNIGLWHDKILALKDARKYLHGDPTIELDDLSIQYPLCNAGISSETKKLLEEVKKIIPLKLVKQSTIIETI